MIAALDLQAKGNSHHCQYRNQCCCSCWWWVCQSRQSSWLVHFNGSKYSWEDKHIWQLSFYNCCIDSPRFSTSLHRGASVQLILVLVCLKRYHWWLLFRTCPWSCADRCILHSFFIRWSCGVLAVNDVFGLGIAMLPFRLRWRLHYADVNYGMHSLVNHMMTRSSESSL